MSTDVRDNAAQNRFEIEVDGTVAGRVEYERRDGQVVMTHTEVGDEYEGQGIAGKLARGALDAVRASGEKVVPTCSYIAGWIDKHPEYKDLVAV